MSLPQHQCIIFILTVFPKVSIQIFFYRPWWQCPVPAARKKEHNTNASLSGSKFFFLSSRDILPTYFLTETCSLLGFNYINQLQTHWRHAREKGNLSERTHCPYTQLSRRDRVISSVNFVFNAARSMLDSYATPSIGNADIGLSKCA